MDRSQDRRLQDHGLVSVPVDLVSRIRNGSMVIAMLSVAYLGSSVLLAIAYPETGETGGPWRWCLAVLALLALVQLYWTRRLPRARPKPSNPQEQHEDQGGS